MLAILGGAELLFQYRDLVRIDTHPNGGGCMLEADWRKVREKLPKEERHEFARQFIRLGVAEKKGNPCFVIAVLKNAAEYLPVGIFSSSPSEDEFRISLPTSTNITQR